MSVRSRSSAGACSDPAFRDRVHSWYLDCCLDDRDSAVGHNGIEGSCVCAVAVPDQVRQGGVDLMEIHDKVSGPLRGPGSGGMGGGAKDADTASGVLEEGKNVPSRSGQCPDFEEVGGEECLCLTTQEGRPRQVVAVRRGFDAVDLEYLPDHGRGYGDSQSRELAVDASVTPAWVVASQAEDQRTDAADGGWSSRRLGVGYPGVVAA
jgi:hypothetical protein